MFKINILKNLSALLGAVAPIPRYAVIVSTVILCASLAAGVGWWWTDVSSKTKVAAKTPTDDLVMRFEQALDGKMAEPIEVPLRVRERIDAIYDAKTPVAELPAGLPSSDLSLQQDVPFYPYWQSGDQLYRFHPMAYGRFLSLLEMKRVEPYLNALEDVGVPVGEDGLLWFYPDNYEVSRMLHRFVPSAISQGQIIGGLIDLSRKGNEHAGHMADRAFDGLTYPYRDGGVNLAGRALLEIPLYDAPPEIILNGWLHALVFVHEYAKQTGDDKAMELLNRNLEFLAQIIDEFDHPETGLSRYSDLTPYRVKLISQTLERGDYWAFYASDRKGLPDKAVSLKVKADCSPYENHLYAPRGDRIVNAWISATQGYETYIMSDKPFRLTIDPGDYDPKSATPTRSDKQLEYESTELGDRHVVHLRADRKLLFRGYPTNFAKGGETNYYHVYHVVALANMLAEVNMPDRVRNILRNKLHQWRDVMRDYETPSGTDFADPQKVLDDLASNHTGIGELDWENLWRRAHSVAE